MQYKHVSSIFLLVRGNSLETSQTSRFDDYIVVPLQGQQRPKTVSTPSMILRDIAWFLFPADSKVVSLEPALDVNEGGVERIRWT